MKKTFSTALAGAAMSFAVHADARAEGFIGAAAGSSEWPSAACATSDSCDRHDATWSVRGGYMFGPYVGLEARYVDLGRARMKTTLEIPDVTIAGDSSNVTVLGARGSDTKTKPYYGVGLDYAFARDWSAGVEATRYRVSFGGTDDVDTLTASLTYRFR